MKSFREMTRQELGEAYDNTSAVANSADLLAIYEEESELVRKSYKLVNIKYGESERQNIDYFHVKDNAPIFVFIHGGYWQMRRKETFHFITKFLAKKGYNVAFIGYTLAPENDLAGIEKELKTALKTLRERAESLYFDKDAITVSGWSAGGHLSVEMLAEDGIVSALAISGIYDLEPISMCFLNDKLNISRQDIKELSPILKPAPTKQIHIVYGQSELSEIIRQSKDFFQHCKATASLKEIAKANHFSILLDEETYSNL
ncbi:MAG: alpha/beta hydrolase [Opitutales bacterium]